MTTAIFFAIFTLACVLAPIAGADSRRSGGRGWWPAGPASPQHSRLIVQVRFPA
jgi:hypothetical protein